MVLTKNAHLETVEEVESGSMDNVCGTVHLIDMEGFLDVKKDESSSSRDIILVPQPSSNPNDPLRWTKTKKVCQFWFLWLWAFLLAVATNFSGPMWTEWSITFNCSFFQLNVSSALCFIFLGVGCLVLQPTSMKLGSRFVYLAGTVIVIVANIVGSQATTINYLYVSNILSGFAAAPVDSLVEISIKDIFYKHELSSYLSYIVFALYAGSDLGPVAAGYIMNSMSWRWCFYFQIIFFGVIMVIQIFYMQSTTFDRLTSQEDVEDEILQQIKSRETMISGAPEEESKSNTTTQNIEKTESLDASIEKRTYWQKMRLFELEYNDKRPWYTIFIRPFFLVSFPAFIWGGLIYGAQMMWLSLLTTTQSETYSVEPYSFSASSVGLTNLGAFFGSFFGMFYGGQFVDWLVIKLSKRNNGIFEPEFRLWAMIIPTIFNAGGLLAYGLGSYYGVHWAVSVVVGQGLLGFAMSASGAICIAYAVDSYPKLASEGLVLMLFIRNCIGCGFTFAIQPWLDKDGLSLTTWLMFMLSLVINGSFVIMIVFGKSFRRRTTKYYQTLSNPHFGEIF